MLQKANPAPAEECVNGFTVLRPPGEGGAEATSRESEYLPLRCSCVSKHRLTWRSWGTPPSAHRTETETNMTTSTSTTFVGAAGVCAGVLLFTASAYGAFTLSDVQFWAGVAPGPDVNEAVLVIDWNDGSTPLAWGYRWLAGETKTGADMLSAIVGADPLLEVEGVEGNFVMSVAYAGRIQINLPVQPYTYWQYWVNNEVIEGTPDNFFEDAGHLLPPNGNPYDGDGLGKWVASSTGLMDRPLANGSWDGFVFGNYGETAGPGEPVAAPVVPEPAVLSLLAGVGVWRLRRRSRF